MFAKPLRLTLAATALAFVAAGSIAIAQDEPVMNGPAQVVTTDLGMILAGPNGMTLYSYDRDGENMSNCYDQCATNWPPFIVEGGAMAEGDWTIVERTDGTSMWAYMGMPLYYWIRDMAPGDTTGDGVGGVWHVVVVPAM